MEFVTERNDIVNMEVDVVVLPANRKLRIGTGASKALFEAAGREQLEAECAIQLEKAKDKGISLVPGVCVPTHAFDLRAKVILHTIVPKWRPKEERKCYEELCQSYAAALVMADEMGMESIAFPVLAAGNNGFDADIAIEIALKSLEQYEPKNKLAQACLVTFEAEITQKVRDLGFTVEEHIDQMHVLDQDMQQAAWWQEEKKRRRQEKEKDKPAVQVAIDQGIEWLQDPEFLIKMAVSAISVAEMVLPKEGWGAQARKVLEVVKPFITGGHK